MLTAARLEEIFRGGSAIDLIRHLGLAGEEIPIVLDDWKRAGIDLGLPDDSRLLHAGTIEECEIYALDSATVTSAEASKATTLLRSINQLKSYIFFSHNKNDRKLVLSAASREGKAGRIELDLARPRRDLLDRLTLLDANATAAPLALSDRLRSALDREAVSSRFFSGFRRGVERLRDELLERHRAETGEAAAGEAVRVLSRLLFLYFVQERGWLDGSRTFLHDRIHGCGREIDRKFLSPLFFECLNTPFDLRSGRARALGWIPYLNGGLFERSDYERRHPRMTISDALLRDLIEDLFERYAFTIREDDEEGVHIDPEMLGRVFESLMESGDRARSGTFYTPRPIVQVLVDRAIAESVAGADPRLAEELRSMLRGDGFRVTASVARRLVERLGEIRLLDPACGTGAFLLRSLQTIESLLVALHGRLGAEPPADLRQRIVEQSLFGVDLKAEAVRLCELRLWLAIVADPRRTGAIEPAPERREIWIRSIPPLPNLDRNVFQGNSLLTPIDFLGDHRADLYRSWRYGLRAHSQVLEEYRRATPKVRVRLRATLRENDLRLATALLNEAIRLDEAEIESIDEGERDLFGDAHGESRSDRVRIEKRLAESRRRRKELDRDGLGFFAWDVHFADVLAEGGFDAVVGNPPWVRRSRIPETERRLLGERYRCFRTGRGFDQADLSVAFFERSIELAREGGVVALLLPSKLLTSFYGEPLRRQLIRDHGLVAIDDWTVPGAAGFDADTFPVGITVRKGADPNERVEIVRGSEHSRLPQSGMGAADNSSPWTLASPAVSAIVRRLFRRFPTLEEQLHRSPVMGVKTGANDSFFLTGVDLAGGSLWLEQEDLEIPLTGVARLVRGRDVRRFRATDSTWMVWPPQAGGEAPDWLVRFAASRGRTVDDLRLSYLKPEHLGIKVAWKDVSRGMQAVVLPETVEVQGGRVPLLPNQTLYAIDAESFEQGYLLSAIFNSVVFDALALTVIDQAKDAHYRYFGRRIALLPLPPLDRRSDRIGRLITLGRRGHAGATVQPEIDEEVAALYGLQTLEIAALRTFVQERLGEA
ncbi:MAG TPA: DNA methyltransferase [Thermoanaerobaculia bacterium]|nr:DNA methyltransferase [Thermoanaerobaculia bacterium]